ncbi:MAG: copper resistance protein B [Gammaproteobacteria bacterium]|nr:copper resistance protein B [Gammaproteobacteria bacterium]MCP4089261.1 copper resistance protein B [Gammaproteobacteria bacterium]MCP4275315.1 copper resistance protein B [Gammaproteobacteria bacterium]MCP4830901.1 copper resistance protein B [Gammaproteobacteria bacterium]MCP4929524.1 copper resistance protein B [Gammaproteobacteria bacterium]
MKNLLLVVCIGLFTVISLPVYAAGGDDPLLASLIVEELEWREEEDLVWNAEAWVGKDRDKLWLKSEGERTDSSTEEFETQLLYNRAVSAFWNMQVGWRGDWQPEQRRSWLALGVTGLAPGFIKTELTAFIADGRSSVRLKGHYEIQLTQRFKLEPKLETNWYSDADPANSWGDGVTDLELSLRLHYLVRPELMPYVGLSYTALYGDTGDFAKAEGDRDRNLQVLAGLSFWF